MTQPSSSTPVRVRFCIRNMHPRDERRLREAVPHAQPHDCLGRCSDCFLRPFVEITHADGAEPEIIEADTVGELLQAIDGAAPSCIAPHSGQRSNPPRG